jgi:hypothetical protein
VLALRAARQIRVAIIDTLDGFDSGDLVTFEGRGYTVMSPEFDWLVKDGSQHDGLGKIPSKLAGRR